MLQLFKKSAVSKNIPLLALALFAAVFMGSKVYASMKGVQELHWTYNDSSTCPETEPDCYTLATGDLSIDCEQLVNAVCGINAPDNGSGQPVIEGTLKTDLESGVYQNKPNIFTMPRIN